MGKIKVGVIGVGRFGRLHLKVLSQIPYCEIVSIADINQELVKEVAEQYEINTYYDDPMKLIDSDLDVIDIVSDEATHGNLVIESLKKRKHVFVEKPLATSVKEAEEIENLQRNINKQVMVGNISRFAYPYIIIRRTLEKGLLGDICQIRIKRNFSRAWFEHFGKRVHPVYESGIHDIDLLLWYANSTCESVFSAESYVSGFTYPDLFSSVLSFKNGLVVSLDSSWCVPNNAPQNLTETLELDGTIDAEMELIATKGTAKFNLLDSGVSIWTEETIQQPDYTLWPTGVDRIGGAIHAELLHFLIQIEKNEESHIAPLHHSVEALRIADAIVRSGLEKNVIKL